MEVGGGGCGFDGRRTTVDGNFGGNSGGSFGSHGRLEIMRVGACISGSSAGFRCGSIVLDW